MVLFRSELIATSEGVLSEQLRLNLPNTAQPEMGNRMGKLRNAQARCVKAMGIFSFVYRQPNLSEGWSRRQESPCTVLCRQFLRQVWPPAVRCRSRATSVVSSENMAFGCSSKDRFHPL